MSRTRVTWAGTLLMSALLLAGGCTRNPYLSIRHKESGRNSSFQAANLSFPDYVDHMRGVIGQTRTDLTPENRGRVVDWNSPFILEPDPAACPRGMSGRVRDGILLIHGLTESPFQLRDLAEHFQRKCFLVHAILLPGHGTVPGDLLEVTYDDWVKATDFGVAALKSQVERYSLAGASTGGTLALRSVLKGEEPRALILFGPALELRSGRASIGKVLRILFGLDEGSRWATLSEDADTTKYESFTANGAFQVWRLKRDVAKLREDRSLKTPVFAVLVDNDMSVDTPAALDYFERAAPKGSQVLFYGPSPQWKGAGTLIARTNRWPAEQVLGMSHVAITNSPDNPHYGRSGDIRNCLHYLEDPARWQHCKKNPVPAGEITPENLALGVMRRLTYNPDFGGMLSALDDFLAQTN